MSQFVDECGLNVKGGDGGAGCVAFRREAHVDRGGPDGGDGGNGGDVVLIADHNVASLLAFRDHPHRRATDGTHGSGKKKHGANGDDLEVRVPVGTVVRDLYTQEVLADLDVNGVRWLAARGGQRGRGNARFLTNRRRAPTIAEQGEPGEERWLTLELKLLADVALVGFPNAGKSTLISRISAAKPKIADYPFTTLEPNLGVVRMDDGFEMVVADIPGLIEGASEGKGLGFQFLRHIERARVLVILLDLAAYDATAPADQLHTMLAELGNYEPRLLARPRIIVGSKGDVANLEIPSAVEHVISAVTGEGLDQLVGAMATAVAAVRDAEDQAETKAYEIHRPEPEGLTVERTDDGAFVVRGRRAERAVALNDLTTPDAIEYVQERFKKLGVDRALARAGAREGDIVIVGSLEFEYADDDLGYAEAGR